MKWITVAALCVSGIAAQSAQTPYPSRQAETSVQSEEGLHVDPQTALAPGQRATIEMKIFVLHGTLEDAFQRAIQQRMSLQ